MYSVLLICVLPILEVYSQTDPPTVRSKYGSFIGSWMTTRKGRMIQAFRGIHYAETPLGENRFEPSTLITEYLDEVNATVDGPMCPTVADDFYPYSTMDEDCMLINVYAPENANSSSSLPVIVYIHSGGFYSFSGRSDIAGPEYLLDRDVVYVAFNYRFQSFGFLSTGDELAPGNNGLKDQVVALKWVQRYISAFGGNPDLVTISGYSVGAMSVMLHMISPMSEGLFHRAIVMSGSPTDKVPLTSHQSHLAVKQAELLDCPTNSSQAIIDCLKTKTWRQIGDSLLGFFEFAYDPVLIWMPVIEPDFGQERFLVEDPTESIRNGRFNSVPLIISQTELEFYWKAFTILYNESYTAEMDENWEEVAPISFILPRDNDSCVTNALRDAYLGGRSLENNTATVDGLGTLYGDGIIGFSVHRLANLMALNSPKSVYYYLFSYVGNSSHYYGEDGLPKGAVHHDDLIYLLGLTYRFPIITLDSPHAPLVDRMTGIWYNFAVNGDPNGQGDLPELETLSWPALTAEDRSYLKIDFEFSVGTKLFEDRFQIWEDLFPIDYTVSSP